MSQWADRYRKLSSEASAEPGQWSTDRAPYQRGIMDCCNDPSVETVTWMSSAQVGKTEVLLNVIGYFIAYDPSPMLCLQPTQKPMAEDFSKDRLATMVRDTPELRGLVADSKSRSSGNTILHKGFPGGHITIGGANSPSGLASRPIRIVLADEIDRYPESAGSEGDPLTLVEKRTLTFWNRKKLRTSTPTVDGLSRIAAAYEEGDQRHYRVPCPHCGHMQRLVWSNVKFDISDGEPDLETVAYECAACHDPIEHAEKRAMLEAGEWVATQPFRGHASFHISALYSPWVTWAEVVQDWHDSRRDTERMRVWTNTVLGETFKEAAREVDPGTLMQKREPYSVPDGILLTTGAVDVQDDRLELLVLGWGVNEEAWHLEHRVFYGDTSQSAPWDDLEGYITTASTTRDDGARLPLAAVGVDSGYMAQYVYEFCRKSRHPRVFCLKGVGGERAITTAPTRSSKAPVALFTVGTDPGKDIVMGRLEGPLTHFSMACDEDYFAQLTAEVARIKLHRGFEIREWQKIRPRNEILDLWIYNLATMYLLNPQWEALGAKKETSTPEQQLTPARQMQSEHFGRLRRQQGRGGFVAGWRK